MTNGLLVGIDLGTTNAKVGCYDCVGKLVAQSVRGSRTSSPREGWYEQEPREWIEVIGQSLRDVAQELGTRTREVVGIAVSTFVTGLVMLDEGGEPLAPSPTWQDQRCHPQGQRLLQDVGSGWIGTSPLLSGFAAKLLWAKEEASSLLSRARQVTDAKAFLVQWLTGVAATDPSSSPNGHVWWPPAFDYIGWPLDGLPDIYPPTVSPGGLSPTVAMSTGYTPGTPVFTGLNDGAAAILGSGAHRPGDTMTTLATNSAMAMVLASRIEPQVMLAHDLFCWPFLSNSWIGGGTTYSGAGSLQWLADIIGLTRDRRSYDALLQEAREAAPGSDGVLFLPYLAGRGTPHPDPDLRGGFVRVRLSSNRADLVRAVLEGVTYSLAEITEEMCRLGLTIRGTCLTGGGARSSLWREIIAAVLDCPVWHSEGDSTLGDAIVAAVGLGIFPDFGSASQVMAPAREIISPAAGEVEAYARLRTEFVHTRNLLSQTGAL